MGKVIIQPHTTKEPISLIGEEAGYCWGADTSNWDRNYKRGLNCITNEHGRTWEYPQIYMTLDGYSARVIRELYTHIGGSPTRLQASTRYIDYEHGFDYVTPPEVSVNDDARALYNATMDVIAVSLRKLEELGVPREDTAMMLPMGMQTKVVLRTNMRNLVDMFHQRLCARAYWEFRGMCDAICHALCDYDEQWVTVNKLLFMPKCEYLGYCPEKNSCGHKPQKGTI